MKILTQFIQFINKPFLNEEIWLGFSKHYIAIATFFTLFLYLFQPNDLSDKEGDIFWICLGFGIATALSYFLFEFLFKQIVKLKKEPIHWTYGKWLLYSFGVLFFMSLGKYSLLNYPKEA